jgi:hypothetical protein
MKTSSYSASKVKKNFEKFFDKSVINRLAKISGFIKRRPKKITPFAFIAGFIDGCFKGAITYSSWASNIGILTGEAVSKQALFERMNEDTVAFAKEVFTRSISEKIKAVKDCRLFKLFKAVIIQDSTTLSLPSELVEFYPGNWAKGEQKAVARLQCIVDIATMQWRHLSLEAFTNNDQSASGVALPVLGKGDLLLRDLGYFVLNVLQQIISKQAYFISRLRYGVTLYDEKGKVVTWKTLSKRKAIIDKKVWIGKEDKVPVRIVMIRLPAKQVNEKIRKAKTDRDKRVNHSDDYYQWLQYNVFVTNVDEDYVNALDIAQLYKVRWQIEILFKSWKSGFRIQKLLFNATTNIHRVNTTIYLLLAFMSLVLRKIYNQYCRSVRRKFERNLSLVKLSIFIAKSFNSIAWLSSSQLEKQLAKHCCFEKRNDRTNMTDFIYTF